MTIALIVLTALFAAGLLFLGYSLVICQQLSKHDDDEDLSTEDADA